MRYVKTINLWADGVQDKLRSGELKPQRGQWMICGEDNQYKCRFVKADQTSIWVIHKKPGCGKAFIELCRNWREQTAK
jgi:hypothetical protein